MIDASLPERLKTQLLECERDWRNAYAGFLEDGGCTIFPEELAVRCGQPPLVAQGLCTVASPMEPLRREPSHQSELLSEIRGGEWLSLLREDGEWALVQGEDGFVGWIARWSVQVQRSGERDALQGRLLGHYARPLGTLWDSDSWASSSLWLGTPLLEPAEEFDRRGERQLVELPWGPKGWLHAADIERLASAPSAKPLLRTATALLGTPYRWGGRSAASLDCSAYVQLVYERVGTRLPRDAVQQSAMGLPLDREQRAWEAGDLLFFGEPVDHVGIYDGKGALLHCRAFVRRQKLGEIPELMSALTVARRIDATSEESTLWLPARC